MQQQQATIEKIHADFSVALTELLERSKFSNEPNVIPVGASITETYKIAAEYREAYPKYNFITQKQLETICFKYGLRAGPYWMFKGKIPEKNRLEIGQFQLQCRHTGCSVPPVFSRQEYRENAVAVCSGFMKQEEAEKEGAIFNIMSRLALVTTAETSTLHFFFYGKGRTVISTVIASYQNLPPLEARHEGIRAKIPLNHIGKWGYIRNYDVDIDPIVVAPADDFRRGMGFMGANLIPFEDGGFIYPGTASRDHTQYMKERKELKQAHTQQQQEGMEELRSMARQNIEHSIAKVRQETRKREMQREHEEWLREQRINDPIVLQPVYGGFLVVTKWGEEAKIPV